MHQGGQLKRDRLAAARGKDRQERFAAHGRTRGHFLQGFSVVGSKRVETEKARKSRFDVKAFFAIGASLFAGRIAQRIEHRLRGRVIGVDPGRNDVCGFCCANEGKCVGEFCRLPLGQAVKIGVNAQFVCHQAFDDACGIRKGRCLDV